MANCTVIGLGKLGACLAAVLSSSGHTVTGVDFDLMTVALINSGMAPVPEPLLQELIDRAPFKAFSDYRSALIGSDIAFIVVPTPSLPDGGFDDTIVREAVNAAVSEGDVGPKIIVICSTVMPGTCAQIAATLPLGAPALVYSPEFIALGSVIQDMRRPDLVLIGAAARGVGLYVERLLQTVFTNTPVITHMPWTDAELAKIAVNAYVTMKISFANNLASICEKYDGVSAARVTRAIGADSRIGTKYLKPGTAFGGPCFPRDSRAYRQAATSVGGIAGLALETDLENAREITRMVDWCDGGGPTAVLGLTYKPNTYVVEESAGVRVVRTLLAQGREVYTYDPEAMDLRIITDRGHSIPLEHLDDANNCRRVCVMTPWPEFGNFDARVPTRDCWGVVPANEFVSRVGEGK